MLANSITLSRLGFLGLCLWLLYQPGTTALAVAVALVIFIVRVVENVFWIAFVDLGLVLVWISLVVVTRGILTDAVRDFALARGMTAFEIDED